MEIQQPKQLEQLKSLHGLRIIRSGGGGSGKSSHARPDLNHSAPRVGALAHSHWGPRDWHAPGIQPFSGWTRSRQDEMTKMQLLTKSKRGIREPLLSGSPDSSSQAKRQTSRLASTLNCFLASTNRNNSSGNNDNVIQQQRKYRKIAKTTQPPVEPFDQKLQADQQPVKFIHQNDCFVGFASSCSSPSSTSTNHSGRKCRILQILSALASRKQRNKGFLLLSLFRAPIVLAALFSLALVATLLVFYGLSFRHIEQAAVDLLERRIHLGPTSHHQNTKDDRLNLGGSYLQRAPILPAPTTTTKRASRNSQLLYNANNNRRQQATEYYANKTTNLSDFERALTVQTECGLFVGRPDDGAIVFRAIPYASAPMGARRWQRPQPIWLDPNLCKPNETYNESSGKSHCAQLSPFTRRLTGQEDCLYLDIYAPQLDQVKKLPVMVYIHGGFLAYGAASQDNDADTDDEVNWIRGQPSARLATELNVLLVSFNYRLGVFGFLALDELARNNGPNGSRANYGLWDQLAALNWVKRNIDSFGGDSNNIVLFGPDAASAMPLTLLTSHTTSLDPPNLGTQVSLDRSHDLFRAVWLTNPSVYYGQTYEQAARHYERLFFNQFPTLCASATVDRLKCLMELDPEQVARHYLGQPQDDPSYRFDDQNSLPIHGIHADQFVTVDGELVQDSYPFEAGLKADQSSSPGGGQSSRDDYVAGRRRYVAEPDRQTNETTLTTDASVGATTSTSKSDNTADSNTSDRIIQTRHAPVSVGDQDNCKETSRCNRSGAQPIFMASKDLLLGSSSQAVSYWPCPRDLDTWNWTHFEHYVSASLNSFGSGVYESSMKLYGLGADIRSPTARPGPKETYLTMVSDIRQICPINELADTLNRRGHRVQRYIVETAPSSPLQVRSDNAAGGEFRPVSSSSWNYRTAPHNGAIRSKSSSDEIMDKDSQVPSGAPSDARKRLEFAFHSWDLLAFFGFEFEPSFKPNKADLIFQAAIRRMVKEFVHETRPAQIDSAEIATATATTTTTTAVTNNDQDNALKEPGRAGAPGRLLPGGQRGYTLFARDGTLRQVDRSEASSAGYKASECKMWRTHLGQSYAWLS